MSSKGGVPDAWDDDWVNLADKPEQAPAKPKSAAKLSKAERRAQHAQQQRQLWDTAENPGRNLWLEAQGVVPLKQEFTPQVTLLSRKPPIIAKKDAAGALGQLSLEDDEDSEEESRKKREAEFEERQRKAKAEREEKQKRYAEARERIMGSTNGSPASGSRDSSHNREANRRSRGNNKMNGNRRSQPDSPAERSPSRPIASPSEKQLFDPEDMGKRLMPKREISDTAREDQPMRQPRGPNNSGRGGFGFSARGGLSGA